MSLKRKLNVLCLTSAYHACLFLMFNEAWCVFKTISSFIYNLKNKYSGHYDVTLCICDWC